MAKLKALHILVFELLLVSACGGEHSVQRGGMEYAECFDITGSKVITMSPTDGRRDTLDASVPFSRIVCMSSTHVACLSLLGHQGDIVGVNGLCYISDTLVRASEAVKEVGDIDFERVIAMKPELLVTSGDGMADYSRLEPFGIKVLHVYDYLEQHPLARAEYVRLFGALTGCRVAADSVFASVRDSYLAAAGIAEGSQERPQVLVNVPYKDAWYVPGRDSYFCRLIRDAGAEVAGSPEGVASSVMTVEKAYALSHGAAFWLHPGWCRTLDELCGANPLFPEFPVLRNGKVFNNIRRAGEAGGNDYYESGAVRPDLVLEDLVRIFHPELLPEKKNVSPEDLHYYIELH